MVRQRNSTIKVNWTKNNKPLEGADITSHAQVGELVVMGYSKKIVLSSLCDIDYLNII